MQAIPSPRPIAPMPSLVVALTLTGAESASARRASISARWGASFGCSQIRVASTLSGAAGELPDHHAEQVEGVGVAPPLLVGREELAEVAEPAGAEQGVDHRVGEDVGVGVAGEAAVVLDLDPAEHQRLALDQAVAVVADADPDAPSAASPSRSSTSAGLERRLGQRLQARALLPSKTQIRSDPELRRGTRAPGRSRSRPGRARGRRRRGRRRRPPRRTSRRRRETGRSRRRACAGRPSRPRPRSRSRRPPPPRARSRRADRARAAAAPPPRS